MPTTKYITNFIFNTFDMDEAIPPYAPKSQQLERRYHVTIDLT